MAVALSPAALAGAALAQVEDGWHDETVWVHYPGAEACDQPASVLDAGMARAHIGKGTIASVDGWVVIEALEAGADLDPGEHISSAAARLLGIDPLDDPDSLTPPPISSPPTTPSTRSRPASPR